MKFWAAPAVYTPEGRCPGMEMAPLVRSLHPMARITAPASMRWNVPRVLTSRTLSDDRERTIVSSMAAMPSSLKRSMNLAAYSGPERASLNVWRPNPSWMHWFRMPPRMRSRSMSRTSPQPASFAAMAAASPAGPPPMTTTSLCTAGIDCFAPFIGQLLPSPAGHCPRTGANRRFSSGSLAASSRTRPGGSS